MILLLRGVLVDHRVGDLKFPNFTFATRRHILRTREFNLIPSPLTERAVLNEGRVLVLNQSDINMTLSHVYYRAWHYKGVTKLIDLLDDQKTFLSFGAFTQKYEVKTTFIDYYGLTHALGPLRSRILALGPRKIRSSTGTIASKI